ncbi:hypothetical protein ACF0H5_011085 [Mactra antiquata]
MSRHQEVKGVIRNKNSHIRRSVVSLKHLVIKYKCSNSFIELVIDRMPTAVQRSSYSIVRNTFISVIAFDGHIPSAMVSFAPKQITYCFESSRKSVTKVIPSMFQDSDLLYWYSNKLIP